MRLRGGSGVRNPAYGDTLAASLWGAQSGMLFRALVYGSGDSSGFHRTRQEPPRGVCAGGSCAHQVISDHADVLRFLALLAGSHVELDALALVEALVAVALDVGEVNEDVIALLARDESKPFSELKNLTVPCATNTRFSARQANQFGLLAANDCTHRSRTSHGTPTTASRSRRTETPRREIRGRLLWDTPPRRSVRPALAAGRAPSGIVRCSLARVPGDALLRRCSMVSGPIFGPGEPCGPNASRICESSLGFGGGALRRVRVLSCRMLCLLGRLRP